MARGSVNIDDYLEDKIKSYMRLNKLSTKNKAINEIIKTFFEYEKVFQNINNIDSKLEKIVSTTFLIKRLEEQIFSNIGFRENVNTRNDKCLNLFYDNLKKNNFRMWD